MTPISNIRIVVPRTVNSTHGHLRLYINEMFAWESLFKATATRSLYLLGAGASRPEIPDGGALAGAVRVAFWDNGIFPVSVQPTTPLKSAILPPTVSIPASDGISQAELDQLTPPEFIEAMLPRLLTRPDALLPAQYRIFNAFPPSVILNFNVDNLADGIDLKHELLYPHGKICAPLAHSAPLREAVAWLRIPPDVESYFNYHRPIREPSSVTASSTYRRLKILYHEVAHVVVIGYSFGAWGGAFDDVESFEMFVDLLRWRPKPVLVVDPRPNMLVALLEIALKRNTVHALRCQWNVLAQFALSGCLGRARRFQSNSARSITSSYLEFEARLL